MKTRQDRINQLSKILQESEIYIASFDATDDDGIYYSQWVDSCNEFAEYLDNKGYRLEQDVAEEILNALGNITVGGLMTKLKYDTDFHDICTKYGVEVQ